MSRWSVETRSVRAKRKRTHHNGTGERDDKRKTGPPLFVPIGRSLLDWGYSVALADLPGQGITQAEGLYWATDAEMPIAAVTDVLVEQSGPFERRGWSRPGEQSAQVGVGNGQLAGRHLLQAAEHARTSFRCS